MLEKRYRDLQASKRPKGNAGGTSSQTRGPRRGAQLSRSSSVPGHDRGNRNRHPQLPRRDQDYGDQTSGSRGKVARSAHSSPLSGSESPLSEVSEASFGLQSYGNSFPYGTPTVSRYFCVVPIDSRFLITRCLQDGRPEPIILI